MTLGTTLDEREIAVGDVVHVAGSGGDFSGTGEVVAINNPWITVKPLRSKHPGWIHNWEFGRSRVTLLPPVSPETRPKRHPNSQRFHELLEEAGALHDKKQADYGKGDDPFANVRASEEWAVAGWVGAMVRLSDKVRRLQSLRGKGSLANESAIDSFMDIAVYALIALVLYEQETSARS